MSLPDEEARALRRAYELLLDLVSGAEKRIPSATRKRASRALRHYPLAAELRWLEFHGIECTCPAHGLDRQCPAHGIEQDERGMREEMGRSEDT